MKVILRYLDYELDLDVIKFTLDIKKTFLFEFPEIKPKARWGERAGKMVYDALKLDKAYTIQCLVNKDTQSGKTYAYECLDSIITAIEGGGGCGIKLVNNDESTAIDDDLWFKEEGSDLTTDAGANTCSSSGAEFQTNKVRKGDFLIITSGADQGSYKISEITDETHLKVNKKWNSTTHEWSDFSSFTGDSGQNYICGAKSFITKLQAVTTPEDTDFPESYSVTLQVTKAYNV